MSKIIKQYNSGKSLRELAVQYKTSHGTISKRLKTLDVPIEKNEGPRHKLYKGKRKTAAGYLMIKQKNHPRADNMGYVFEHILVVEKDLGRYLKWFGVNHSLNEIVHHRNEIPSDNRLENLQVMTRKEHISHHKMTLNLDTIKKIRDDLIKDKSSHVWGIQRKLALKYGTSEYIVSRIKLGKIYFNENN